MADTIKQLLSAEQQEKVLLFYIERILELSQAKYVLLAKKYFHQYQQEAQQILSEQHYQYLETLVNQPDDWCHQKEREFWKRMQNAEEFNEYKVVHDTAHEIMLHYDLPSDQIQTHDIHETLLRVLSRSNAHYIEPDEIQTNTFIDGTVSFIVDERKNKQSGCMKLKGNPGFYIIDALGKRYRCFIKQVDDIKEGDTLALKITNIPGLSLTTHNGSEPVLYLEPRVSPGDIIQIELANLSHTGNSFTFRHYSYDGFLWFKCRGVNKRVYNERTLKPNDKLYAKVLYTSEGTKRKQGKICRLGIVKAIPLRRVAEEQAEENPNTNVANFLS